MSSMPPQLWPRMWSTLEAERRAHRIDLAQVEVDGPARRVIRLVGVAAALLVVEDDPPTGRRERRRSTRGSRGRHPVRRAAAAAARCRSAARPLASPTIADPRPAALEGDEATPSALQRRVDGHEVRCRSCRVLPCEIAGSGRAARRCDGRPTVAPATASHERRRSGAADVDGGRAAGGERAAGRQVRRIGRHARDLGQASPPLRRWTGCSPRRPRGVRVVAASRSRSADGRLLHDPTGVQHDRPLAELRGPRPGRG